ncbi:hypothetical protein B1R32_10832 [Abditibacterium utsteinense]|uniref:Uncharacterized protein n=1 Tax=Abditibacterium utsteinense TaxID=1960156 RepID=A0A2S8SSS6_9BACT|nr:hypothetical protein [Abditibacterium utsteinense]PQV63828.1 hypothetical protein B1R32_10832 [Abditibacterium utsteinense]
MIYDQNELKTAIEDGERKLAVKRQQRRSRKRHLVILAALLGILVPFALVAGVVASHAPSAPLFVVTWPKPKVRQVLAPGQTILARAGQPFSLEVTNSENWEVMWKAAGVESGGDEFSWAPANEKSELAASCRFKANGWQQFFAWTWPRREITLQTVAARKIGDYGRVVDARGGAWIYPHVFAVGTIRFDERALPLLAKAISATPKSELASELAVTSETPTAPLWEIVSNFDPSSPAKTVALSSARAVDGTFAVLRAADMQNSLPQIASSIVKSAPNASVKFVLRLDQKPIVGILRLAFDGKSERRAWVRRPGESAGGPLTGWEEGVAQTNLLPDMPRG